MSPAFEPIGKMIKKLLEESVKKLVYWNGLGTFVKDIGTTIDCRYQTKSEKVLLKYSR